MRAMILAAGRGDRLRPLTDNRPKPLIKVGNKTLLEYHLEKLAKAGFREIVINLSYLGQMIESEIGNGSRFGLNIEYSWEHEGALETGGGILQALDMLGPSSFALVNGDIFSDYSYKRLRSVKCDWAHLVLVPNPAHNPNGDFALEGARIHNSGETMATFSGIAVYHPRLLANCSPGKFSIVPLLRNASKEQLVTGELHKGIWSDVGTVERLESTRNLICSPSSE